MAKREKQKHKLFRLLQILMQETDENHGLSMSEIIERLDTFGVSAERKSIYEDFLTLEELGFPVSHTSTRPPKYFLEERIFELAELKMLVDAVQSSRFITAKKSRDIIKKLETFAGAASNELVRQVYVEDRVKTSNTGALYAIDSIHNAINSDCRLAFKYFEYDGNKNKVFRRGGDAYEVSPYALLWSEENYYLVAYEEASGIMKNFRVDKMQDVNQLNDKRTRCSITENFNPADYSRKIFGMYGGREELVTLEFRDKLAGVVIDRFGLDHTFIKTDFGFKISLRVMISPTFYAWILGFGEDVRILSPTEVRNELCERLMKTLEFYEKGEV